MIIKNPPYWGILDRSLPAKRDYSGSKQQQFIYYLLPLRKPIKLLPLLNFPRLPRKKSFGPRSHPAGGLGFCSLGGSFFLILLITKIISSPGPLYGFLCSRPGFQKLLQDRFFFLPLKHFFLLFCLTCLRYLFCLLLPAFSLLPGFFHRHI